MRRNHWLVIGGTLSAAAALMHVAIVFGGAQWYRFFGAGEQMAEMAERGSMYPALVTFGIAAVLGVWSAYAFAGAGLLRRPPFMRTALVVISGIYLLRALGMPIILVLSGQPVDGFAIWSSAIVLVYGTVYAIGTWRAWPTLSEPIT